MNKITRVTLVVFLSITMIVTMACGIVNNLMGGSSGTAASLWPDVPPLDGATKANLDLPLAAKLAVQAAFQGKLEFIAYTSNKNVADIATFYSADRMKASGWSSESGGCTAPATSDSGGEAGAFCFFGKNDHGKELGLAIIIGQDTKTKVSNIFYIRVDVTPTPTPQG